MAFRVSVESISLMLPRSPAPGTFVRAGEPMIADSVVWAKLAALGEGAEMASKRLWS